LKVKILKQKFKDMRDNKDLFGLQNVDLIRIRDSGDNIIVHHTTFNSPLFKEISAIGGAWDSICYTHIVPIAKRISLMAILNFYYGKKTNLTKKQRADKLKIMKVIADLDASLVRYGGNYVVIHHSNPFSSKSIFEDLKKTVNFKPLKIVNRVRVYIPINSL
jgi:hypothetical protein